MARMISQLLDLARVRTGGLRLEPRPVDLGELCQLVVGELRHIHPEARVDVTTAGSLHGRWDGARLAQVMSDLVGNAIQHGEPRAPVRVLLDGRDGQVTIRVENRGAIADEILPTLFAPYGGPRRPHDGTRGLGLSLYIAKEIVTAHRGAIDVHTDHESGTCFEIALPTHGEVQR
jgi:signal transduction histidine kinase